MMKRGIVEKLWFANFDNPSCLRGKVQCYPQNAALYIGKTALFGFFAATPVLLLHRIPFVGGVAGHTARLLSTMVVSGGAVLSNLQPKGRRDFQESTSKIGLENVVLGAAMGLLGLGVRQGISAVRACLTVKKIILVPWVGMYTCIAGLSSALLGKRVCVAAWKKATTPPSKDWS